MAVIIHKIVKFRESEQEVKTYQPSRAISKEERIQANRLDEVLEKKIPEFANLILSDPLCENNLVRRWFTLGTKFREIVDDRNLVLQEDIENGLIWQAISYYLPKTMLPERSNLNKSFVDKQHKRQDHFSLCYELGNFSWEEIKWIKNWSFVHEITARPALLRDKRIFIALGENVASLNKYPTTSEFREVMKLLTQQFPTKSYRESLIISDDEVKKRVKNAVGQIIQNNLYLNQL